ncbi:MAG: hypothetical protein R2830_04275 [Saprospiraceae bacterium]
MKTSNLFLPVLLMLFFSNSNGYSQEKILAGEQWEKLTRQQFLADYFKDYFVNLGVEVMETGERITVMNKGDHFEIVNGIDESKVDFVLPIGTQNVLNLIKHAEDGKIDDQETYKILAVFFTPMTAMTLKNPLMTKNIPRVMSKMQNNIHVTLFSPDKTESVSHTLIYLNREWIVVPGFYGKPKRKFELNVPQAIEYQARVFNAIKVNKKKDWRKFKRWYMSWRKDVSVATK